MDVRQSLCVSTVQYHLLANTPILPRSIWPAINLTWSSSVKRIGRALAAMIEVLSGAHPPTPRSLGTDETEYSQSVGSNE